MTSREEALGTLDGAIDRIVYGLGTVPRSRGWIAQFRDRIPRPAWASDRSSAEIEVMLNAQDQLYREGSLAWAGLVKANAALYKPGRETSPAVIVFAAPQRQPRLTLAEADSLAQATEELRWIDPPEVLREDARVVDDDTKCHLMHRLDQALGFGADVFVSTVLVHRAHLPANYLAERVFPVLVSPGTIRAVQIVPSRYWPRELRAFWMEADSKWRSNGPPDSTPDHSHRFRRAQ